MDMQYLTIKEFWKHLQNALDSTLLFSLLVRLSVTVVWWVRCLGDRSRLVLQDVKAIEQELVNESSESTDPDFRLV